LWFWEVSAIDQEEEVLMENPRPEKVAKVAEVKQKFDESHTVLLTEYRGLDVPAIAELRRDLREAGGEYKIYKNTLVRLAAREAGADIEALLTGPTAIAFVTTKADGSPGDAAAAAKALREFSKKNAALVLKGGLLNGKVLDESQIKALADLPSREVLLARLAGGIAAPLQQFAGLLQALPRNLAYGLKALIDQAPAAEAPAEAPKAEAPAAEPADDEAPVADEPATEVSDDTPAPEATEDTPAAEATDDTPAEAGSEQEN